MSTIEGILHAHETRMEMRKKDLTLNGRILTPPLHNNRTISLQLLGRIWQIAGLSTLRTSSTKTADPLKSGRTKIGRRTRTRLEKTTKARDGDSVRNG